MEIKKNAIILAAGKSSRFAPFTYEKPKGLFRVKGELLIERQVRQLIEAGISNIYIVVGYMKEKFFFLEQRYPEVKLLVNNRFGTKGNLYSLYVARAYLGNTYLSYADLYFEHNPFLMENAENVSYHACTYRKGRFNSFALRYSDAGVITAVSMGGENQMSMVGNVYLNESFSKRFVELLEREINEFRVSSLFWEEYYERHINELTLYVKESAQGEILEFNTIDDLKQFDADFLYNVDSDIIGNICNVLVCQPTEITNIYVINAGLTNVSFCFTVKDKEYVYRHPGGTAGNLINRDAEQTSERIAKELDVDASVIHVDETGWKLSYCVQGLTECDFRKYPEQLAKGMDYLRRMHQYPVQEGMMKTFDDFEEGLRLMKIASCTKGNLLREFADEIAKAERLDTYLKADAERMGIHRVVCHNDTYEPNFLATKTGDLYLIDWEYAGLNDPANDLACFFCRYDYSEQEIMQFMETYLQHQPTEEESRHYIGYIALCAFYWIGWGLYKGSVGDDDGFFFLPAYRNFHRFIDRALKSYEE